jgi:acyl-CoA dehydrogenase
MDFNISPDLELIIQTVRDYVDKTLLPREMQMEHQDRIPPEIIREMGSLGFFGLPFSEEDGGLGVGLAGFCLALEQLARANTAIGAIIMASSGQAGLAISLGGTPEQRERWLPGLAAGETLGAFALSEEQAGSSLQNLRTTATRMDDGYRLSGGKAWVLNGPDAGLYIVFARLSGDEAEEGVAAFVVERDTPGLSRGRAEYTLGLHGAGMCALGLHECVVPATHRLPGSPDDQAHALGAGIGLAERVLDHHRIALAAQAVGLAGRLLTAAREFATTRRQFGQPVAAFQAVQWMLADSATEQWVARQAMLRAAWEWDNGTATPQTAAMAKLFASEMLYRVSDRAMQVHGGMGYMKELWIERGYRDARAFRIWGGTSEVMRGTIARGLGCPDST